MKKTFTFFMMACCALSVTAQDFQKGSILLGGNLTFSDQKATEANNTSKNTSWSINPSVGRFYQPSRLVGANLNYGQSNSSWRSSRAYGAGVFLRQYLPLGKSFYVVAEEGIGVRHVKSSQLTNVPFTTDSRQTDYSAYFFPGIAYRVTPHFQLELALTQMVSINYVRFRQTQHDAFGNVPSSSNTLSIQAGPSAGTTLGNLSFGMKWLLR